MRKCACAVVVAVLVSQAALAATRPAPVARPTRPPDTGQAPVPQAGSGIQGPEAIIAKTLQLTPDQEPQWKAESERSQSVMGPLWIELGSQTAEAKALLDKGAADGVLKPKIEAMNMTRAAIRAEQDRHEAAILSILKPAQQAKFTMMFADRLRQGWGRPMPRVPQQVPPVK